jgi:hypothetical protein
VATAENPAAGVGLTHVDEFSSVDGVAINHAHKYSLISTYDNPTNQNADSMASIFLGLDDPELAVPTSDQLARTSAALFDSKTLVLHTNIGNITATLDRERASETVIQVARFALAGVLDSTRLIGQKNSVIVALPSQKVVPLMQPFRAEAGVARRLGTVSYCLAGARYPEPTIVIDANDPPQLDNLCVGFARIARGIDLVAALQAGTSASLAKAETIGAVTDAKKVAAK